MTPQLALIKLRLRLNKLHSSDYDNIPDWIAVEAINKARTQVIRRLVRGLTRTQEGDEETRGRIDDLQHLLSPPTILKGKNKKGYFESVLLPDNYLYYKWVIPKATKGECKAKPLYNSRLVEEANVPDYLKDFSEQPNFEWRQTIQTIRGNKIIVYTSDEFKVEEIEMVYYVQPVNFDVTGYKHESGVQSTNVDLHFKDDLAEIILDEAAAYIAGNTEMINQYQTSTASVDKNT